MTLLANYSRLAIDFNKLMGAHLAAINAGVGYDLGDKDAGNKTAIQLGDIDCSGYVGWLLFQATNGKTNKCGLGTWHLNEWASNAGFKRSNVASGILDDGILRLAIMVRSDAINIGHTCLIYNGATLESHGGKGVDTREWTGQGWQKYARVYCLAENLTD